MAYGFGDAGCFFLKIKAAFPVKRDGQKKPPRIAWGSVRIGIFRRVSGLEAPTHQASPDQTQTEQG